MNATPQFAIVPQGFDPRRIDPAGLAMLRGWIVNSVMPVCGRYGQFVHEWLQAEEIRQRKNADQVSLEHLMGLPNDLPMWELHDVALAAYLAHEISKTITCEMLGVWFDHQVSGLTHYLTFQLAPLEAIEQ